MRWIAEKTYRFKDGSVGPLPSAHHWNPNIINGLDHRKIVQVTQPTALHHNIADEIMYRTTRPYWELAAIYTAPNQTTFVLTNPNHRQIFNPRNPAELNRAFRNSIIDERILEQPENIAQGGFGRKIKIDGVNQSLLPEGLYAQRLVARHARFRAIEQNRLFPLFKSEKLLGQSGVLLFRLDTLPIDQQPQRITQIIDSHPHLRLNN